MNSKITTLTAGIRNDNMTFLEAYISANNLDRGMKLRHFEDQIFKFLMVFTDLDIHLSFGLHVGIYFGINMNVLKDEGIGIQKKNCRGKSRYSRL